MITYFFTLGFLVRAFQVSLQSSHRSSYKFVACAIPAIFLSILGFYTLGLLVFAISFATLYREEFMPQITEARLLLYTLVMAYIVRFDTTGAVVMISENVKTYLFILLIPCVLFALHLSISRRKTTPLFQVIGAIIFLIMSTGIGFWMVNGLLLQTISSIEYVFIGYTSLLMFSYLAFLLSLIPLSRLRSFRQELFKTKENLRLIERKYIDVDLRKQDFVVIVIVISLLVLFDFYTQMHLISIVSILLSIGFNLLQSVEKVDPGKKL